MRYKIQRLDTLLSAWEDWWFCFEKMYPLIRKRDVQKQLGSRSGALVNHAQLRKFLLGLHKAQRPINFDRFLAAEDYPDEDAFVHLVAPPLVTWNLFSRRVYSISPELQAILALTSLRGINWRDIELPFDSFAVALGKPIAAEEARGEYDFVVVSRIGDAFSTRLRRGVHFYFYTSACDGYVPMTVAERQYFNDRTRKQEPLKRHARLLRHIVKTDVIRASSFYLDEEAQADDPITALAEASFQRGEAPEAPEGAVKRLDSILRIVLGMVLYLRTIPPRSPHEPSWRSVPRSGAPDPRAVTKDTEVCTVSNIHPLTHEERVGLGIEGTAAERAAFEMCWHFIEGHWRRPPGLGSDPGAERSVHVRPYMARADRMPDNGGLPGGALEV